jgi:hypothetical protein
MKKSFTSVIILILISFSISAQKNKDVLHLKNGSSIYGKLLEANDSLYKIKTPEGSIFIFSSPEVDKFVNETQFYDGRKKSGFGFAIEAGVLVGAQSSEYKAPFSFNILLNVTGNTKNIIGLGSGVEYLGQPFTPLFLEYKYLFSEKKTTPFIFVRGGKLFHMSGDATEADASFNPYGTETTYKGGGSFTIGTGISWSKDDFETYLSFAYRNANTSYTEESYNNQTTTYKNAYNRLELKFGFKF